MCSEPPAAIGRSAPFRMKRVDEKDKQRISSALPDDIRR
jgi:hypothetical protein